MKSSLSALAVLSLAAIASAAPTRFADQCRGRAPLVINGDNDFYFKEENLLTILPLEKRISKDGPRQLIEAMAEGGKVTHFFMCAVGQRADYDSKVIDPIWLAIDEAKARGIAPNEWPVNAKRLHDLGVDLFSELIAHGRRKGISVWISQRMNDVHHVDRPWNMRTNRFWYDRRDLHRSHGVDKKHLTGFWTDEAFNYAFPEVQDFHFNIFKELVDRYDADGFELDFLRFWQHLTPGREREEAHVLTAFIRRCRDYANAKSKERGRPILLSSRVPSSYEAARAFGYDPESWASQGLLDLIVVANFWAAADYNLDFKNWKRRLNAANPAVHVLPCVGDNVASGASGVVPATGSSIAGWSDNVLADGADGLYFFNAAYLDESIQRRIYSGPAFSRASISASPRRYLCSYHDCVPKGAPNGSQLPAALSKGAVLKIAAANPVPASAAKVVVGMNDPAAPVPSVKLNGAGSLSWRAISQTRPYGDVKIAYELAFPVSALKRGENLIEIAPANSPAKINWAEIAVTP